MSPVPKVPVWGDSQRIQQLASGLKREGGTYGAVVQRNEPGRPTTGQANRPAPAQIPPEHQSLAQELAAAEWSRQKWAQIAQTSPTPWVQGMLAQAEDEYERVAATFYDATPNFEE